MSNPGIFQSSFPAERMRGAKLVEDFRDALTVARNKWTAFGAPTYAQGGGVILNGTTQYLTHPLVGELNSPSLTIHIEFWPTFAADDGVAHYLLDTTGGRTVIIKEAGNNLVAYMGSTTSVLTAAIATYQPYWKQNGRNLLSVSCTSAANTMWLNGNQIASSVTAWTAANPTVLFAGCNAATTVFFPGTITRLYIGHHTSTLAEHQAYYNQSMFSWRNRATVDLPLNTAQYDPTGVRTLDVSGHANHATLGNGAGVGVPTQGRGFMTFDGVNDYLSGIADPAGSYTVLGYKDTGTGWTFFANNDLTEWTPIMTSGGFTGKLGHLMVVPEVLNATQLLDAAWQLRQYGSEV